MKAATTIDGCSSGSDVCPYTASGCAPAMPNAPNKSSRHVAFTASSLSALPITAAPLEVNAPRGKEQDSAASALRPMTKGGPLDVRRLIQVMDRHGLRQDVRGLNFGVATTAT